LKRQLSLLTVPPVREAQNLSILGEKSMAMKLVKNTADYSIYKRSDDRFAVKDGNKNAVNGEDKVRILAEEGLVKVAAPAAPEPVAEDAAVEAAPAEEAAEEEVAEEAAAPAEEPAAEEAPAEEEEK
jgi:hypothetical protein